MSDWPNHPQESADDVAIVVAVVGRDASGTLMVTACNDRFLQMAGASSADARTFPIPFDSLIAQPSGAELRAMLEASLTSGSAQRSERACEFRESVRSWRLSLKPLGHSNSNSGSAAHEVLVTGVDLTPKRDLTHALEVHTSRFRSVVDSAYDAIVTIDERHRITLFNRAAENLFGYTSAEVLGQPIETLLPDKFRAGHWRNVQKFADSDLTMLRQTTPPRMDESNSVFGQHKNGTTIPVEIAISKISVDGLVEFTAVVRDITERAQLMALLKKQAVTDALTGLPNRREFLNFVDKVLSSDDGLSVFILDIDFFKKINDSYGHDVGDEVLCVLASAGMSIVHASELFARWGGEEFVAALPGADASRALRIAEQLRRRFEQQDFEHTWRLKPIPFTVSIGVVTREAGERDVDALMRRADRALYRAKELGRNRVEVG